MNYEEAIKLTKKYGQEQLFDFYNELSGDKKESLLNQISKIDFEYMKSLYKNKDNYEMLNKDITNVDAIDSKKINKSMYEKLGENSIKNGQLAVCSMAGGQGTRLGFNGPKATYMLDIGRQASIFEIMTQKLKEAKEKYGVHIKWYIMTSEQNNDETVAFFEKNNYFGYDENYIKFFKQGELPLLDENGKVILKEKDEIFMAPDGNGGIFRALGNSGILSEMKKNGVKYLAVGNVDNILIHMVDPLAIGLMIDKNAKILSKSFMKPRWDGKWGVFCKMDGKLGVIEYIETPEELLRACNSEGELLYGDAHFGCNFFTIDLLEKIENEKLPMHAAFKKNFHVNSTGEHEEINAYKFEAFIFDVFSATDDVIILRIEKDKEFAPVKNKEGNESPETAVELYKKFYGIK